MVIDDELRAIERFERRFAQHQIVCQGIEWQIEYKFINVELERTTVDPERWQVPNSTFDKLQEALRQPLDLLVMDYAFVPKEVDEKLTEKLEKKEIASPNDLFDFYVLDAHYLFKELFSRYAGIKARIEKSSTPVLFYTFPSDNLMALLGDAEQRGTKLSKVLKNKMIPVDTRQLLYGGDKELERMHDRKLYHQLLAGHLNLLILEQMHIYVLELMPSYQKIRIKRSLLAIILLAAFAGGAGSLIEFLASKAYQLSHTDIFLALFLLVFIVIIVFLTGCFFAVFFERLIRNLVSWLKEPED